jgi:hypothetical protein
VSEKKEILNLDELRQPRLADDKEYIVITNGSQATVHKVDAKCIATGKFQA